jgi:hypothetical protein
VGFQEVEVSRFKYNRYMKVIRLSDLRTGLLHHRKYPWYSFLLEEESTPEPQCGWIVELGTSVKTLCNWQVVWLVLSRETANCDWFLC